MGYNCGQLSSRVMNSMGRMDIDGFVRHFVNDNTCMRYISW
jgi:hypothetical protein